MGEKGRVIAVAIGALILVGVFKSNSPGEIAKKKAENDWAISMCKKMNAQAILDSWRSTIDDIRRRPGEDWSGPSIHLDVWTNRWEAAGSKGRASIALAAYCSIANPDGKGMAIIKGSRGENLASVSDGNYFD